MTHGITTLTQTREPASIEYRRRQLIRLLAERKLEGLSLYRALPYLEEFHECRKKWRILSGSNRSSKTLTATAEAVRCVCGADPHDKYPKSGGNAIVVAREGDGLSMLWRKMAAEGEFKRIQDEHSGLWRAVRPDPNDPTQLDPYDAAHSEKWRDAAPLLPPRMIASVAWEDKAKGIPRYVRLINDWRILFRSCGGAAKPPQGDRYHFAFFDEEMDNPQFFEEVTRGLVQVIPDPIYMPRGIWSATAQVAAPQFLNLREDAENGSDTVALFEALIVRNPYISEKERRHFLDTLSPEEREARYYGKPAIAARRIYRDYTKEDHTCDPFDIPETWCIYVIVDPGTQRAGTVIIAIDPEELHLWVIEAWPLVQADATRWAARVADSLEGRPLEAVICDSRAGGQRSMGAEKPVASYYYDALIAAGVEPRRKGPMNGFFRGTPDVEAREQALIAMLKPRECEPGYGTPKLRVFRGTCEELEREIYRASNIPKANSRRRVQRDSRHEHDILDCLEYAAAYEPRYFAPPDRVKEKDASLWKAYQELHKPSTASAIVF